MQNRLLQLKNSLTNLLSEYVDKPPEQWMSVFQSHHIQRIREIPFLQPTLLLVVEGDKSITMNNTEWSLQAGDLFCVPADTTLWLSNIPHQLSNNYFGIAVVFSFETLRLFRNNYGTHLNSWDTSTIWNAPAPDSVITALLQWVELSCNDQPIEPQIAQHRQIELLLLLAQAGLAGNLLVNLQASWRQRVSHNLHLDLSRSWKIEDICKILNISESSLRRRLQKEQSSFRELLEEARLTAGLSLLMETPWSIGRVADSVGYQSQSRFGERFKQRFGTTPTELKRTRLADNREMLKVNGE